MPKHARKQPGYESPSTAQTVRVYDDRPELGNPMKLVATFQNVPYALSNFDVLKQYGIADHLHVTRDFKVIQEGRR